MAHLPLALVNKGLMDLKIKPGRGGTLGNLKGQAGVWAVASQLALRGHVPLFPGVDIGYDLVSHNGLKLQVKVATITLGSKAAYYPTGAYVFNLRRGVWDMTTNRASRKESRTYQDVADFFVLWGIDENRFWIVPTSVTQKCMWFGRNDFVSRSNNFGRCGKAKEDRLASMEDRWDLLDISTTSEVLITSAETILV